MRKLPIFLLLVLFISGTLQKKGQRRRMKQLNISVIEPRSFKGILLESGTNDTPALLPSDAPPALLLLSSGAVDYLSGPLSTLLIPVVYMLVVTVGIPANVCILCLLATKVRKVSSAILYCSLAVSDLLLLISLFFRAHYHLYGNHWVLGESACRVVTACFYGNLYCSAVTLACISVKRYLAVVFPFQYKSLPKRIWTAWVCLAVWGVFSAAVVPELLVQQSYRLPQLNRTTCHDVLPLDQSSHAFLLYYNLALTVLGLLVPLVVTVLCFARIVRELNRSHHDWAVYVKASSLVFSIFLVCFVPAGLVRFLHYVLLSVSGSGSLYVYVNVAACLCCVHACLDPFLFVLMSKSAGSRLYFMTFRGKTLSISV